MTDEVCEVVITAPDSDWLASYTHALVEDRLAACGHNITAIRSVYRWRGEVYDRPEARVALHTRRSLVAAIVERTNREHPYELPCVIAVPLHGSPEYLTWVLDETAPP